MPLVRWWLPIALVACGGRPPASSPPPAIAAPKPPPPCIHVADEAAPVSRATAADGRVSYCMDKECFAVELATGKLLRLDHPPPEPPRPAAHVETTNPDVKVCTGDTCKTLTSKIMPGTTPLRAATNDAGTFAVVLLGEAEAGKGYAEVWDVVAGKRAASFKYAQGDFKCGELRLLGDTIYVSASTCAGPAARAQLFSLKGKKIANVGNKDFGMYGDAYVQLDATTWAFLEENGHRIAVQDVVKGKVKKTIDTSALWQKDGETKADAMGNPGESALVRLDDKLVVVAGTPANGSVAVVDPLTGKVDVVHAPLCPGS
jgi:hypothetical protein